MKITPVDQHNNLFYIEDAYPVDIVDQLRTTDPLSHPYGKVEMQDNWPRRNVQPLANSVYTKLTDALNQYSNQISEAMGQPVYVAYTGIWLDEAGFAMGKHLDDDRVVMSLQIYLNDNDEKLGTTFFNEDGSIRCQFPYKFNCGYMMINGPDQYHGMTVPVPADSYRISSYSWIYPKS